jgi:membrane associated rhomboid family serine protease
MFFPLYDLNPHRRFPLMTVLIIFVNIAITAWMYPLPFIGQPRPARVAAIYQYGFTPLRVTKLSTGQPVEVPTVRFNRRNEEVPGLPMTLPADPLAVYLTFLTTMFLHGGWLHVLTNMWMLWVFGNNVEDRLGRFMFLLYYLLGGMVGTLCQWAFDPTSAVPVIGASGAVATVLGGYAITYPKAMVKTLVFVVILDLPALLVLGIWFVMQILTGLSSLHGIVGAPVAVWAHIGGFLAGIALIPFMGLGAAPPGTNWHKEVEDLFRFDDPRTRVE